MEVNPIPSKADCGIQCRPTGHGEVEVDVDAEVVVRTSCAKNVEKGITGPEPDDFSFMLKDCEWLIVILIYFHYIVTVISIKRKLKTKNPPLSYMNRNQAFTIPEDVGIF